MAPGGAQMGEWRRFRGLQDRGIRRPAEALTSHYPLRGGVDLSFESVLRHHEVFTEDQHHVHIRV